VASLFVLLMPSNANKQPVPQVPLEVVGIYPFELFQGSKMRAIIVQRGWEHLHNDLYLEWIAYPENPNEQAVIVHSIHVGEIAFPWALGSPRWEGKAFHVTGVFTMNPEIQREFRVIPDPDGTYVFEGGTTLDDEF